MMDMTITWQWVNMYQEVDIGLVLAVGVGQK